MFAFALDDVVIVYQLLKDASNETAAIYIYGAARTTPLPSTNAVGTRMLFTSTLIIVLAALVFRRAARHAGMRRTQT